MDKSVFHPPGWKTSQWTLYYAKQPSTYVENTNGIIKAQQSAHGDQQKDLLRSRTPASPTALGQHNFLHPGPAEAHPEAPDA
ncbi:hypothetical protein [Kistimonas asteriae]|uniref:hypothetical protein n=1 Tax=Kistimonas asteriae TaxID=517724 RepID=UPI001BA58751|nr:hypothetical protein [Kistimonas asteriae]